MSTMRVVRVAHPNGPFEIVECEIPEPDPGTVRVKVQACGVCHGDSAIYAYVATLNRRPSP